jgi:AcrR family transcriptional regulator
LTIELKPLPRRLPDGVRAPAQARSRDRFEQILAAAEALAEIHPIADISVALIAERSRVKRATLYQMFGAAPAIFRTLGQRFLDELYADLSVLEAAAPVGWREMLQRIGDITVAFYSRHPSACALFLGDGSLHGLRLIDQDFDLRYVHLARRLLGNGPTIQPGPEGDPIQVMVTLFISALSLSVHAHGRITPYFHAQAAKASAAYMALLLT